MRRLITALSLALLALAPAAAQSPDGAQSSVEAAMEAAADFGPAVGQTAPDFTVRDATGASRSLADLSGENGLVLYFNRSLDWCPVCLRQALEVNEARDRFAEAGWGVAVLTYDSAETLAQVADRRALEIVLLGDEDSAVIDQFDVRDPIYADPDHMAYGVPYPIAFAIRPDGSIVAKFWHEAGLGQRRGYATRVSTEDVIAALPG
jgi:peroxiredoxin